jgi:hypothetical protein
MRRPSTALLVAGIALTFAVTGTAVASGLITSADIKDHTIQTRDISPAALAALQGQQGPAGPAGAAGAPGAPGPAGGPLDPSRIVHVTGPIFSLPAGQAGPRFYAAPCPAGAIALGGGFTLTGPVHVSSSTASDFQQGWQIGADNPGTTDGTAQVQAVCITT